MKSSDEELANNLFRVRERIDSAAARSGRKAEEITLIAVSKMHPAEKIRQLYEAGVRHFGENRVQEWEAKHARVADLDATWHMIGHLQKNKAARAIHLFHTVDSIDGLELAEKLERAKAGITTGDNAARPGSSIHGISQSEQKLRVLVEVKLDPEPKKSGVDAKDLPRLAEGLLLLPHLDLCGLMTVPSYFDDPEEARPYFRRLRELRDVTRKQLGLVDLQVLSMGMSHDFEIAIEEGATEIRVGTALFGKRE